MPITLCRNKSAAGTETPALRCLRVKLSTGGLDEVESFVGGDTGGPLQNGDLTVATKEGPLNFKIGYWLVELQPNQFMVATPEAFALNYDEVPF
jgi:hypothetical protein